MNMRHIAVIVMAGLCALGCRQDAHMNVYVDALNAEKRALEDVIYELEYDYELALQKLQDAEKESDQLRRRLGEDSGPAGGVDLSPRGDEVDGELRPPMIEFGAPAQPDSVAPPENDGSAAPRGAPPPENNNGGNRGASAPEEIAAPVTQLYINPLRTNGADFDHTPGDDGLALIVEPRTAADNFVSMTGPLSVVLLDPAISGEAARVARWEIDEAEVRKHMQNSASAKGIQLELPWPDGPPQNVKLQLFVRMNTPDGRQLEASRDIFVTLPGQFSQRWTPRPADRRIERRDAGGAIADRPREPLQPRVSDNRGAEAPVGAAAGQTAPPAAANRQSPATPKRSLWRPYR